MQDILIVEDGLHERERLKRLFQGAGFSVSTAEGVEEAQILLQSSQFRLTILDVGLGDKSGSYLFDYIQRSSLVPYVIIFTGNPSVHLKQRFLDEGAVAYIVKGSPDVENDIILGTVKSFLGQSSIGNHVTGDGVLASGYMQYDHIPLSDFVARYVSEQSRALFLEEDNRFPCCSSCGGDEYIVTFAHKTQIPPSLEGKVLCASCGKEMDPEVG